jgi:peptide/nickel transport system substrate-binding protein
MAIDTAPILKMAGGNIITIKRPEALCNREQRGCGYTRAQYAYDPATAKKLLAEAGYADGFDLEIVARDTGRATAEAITGQLRAVGIRASVKLLSFAAYRQYQTDGKQQALVSGWGGGNIPDVASTLAFMFEPGTRDYAGVDQWFQWAGQAGREMDDTKRRAIVAKLADDVTDQAYITMLTSAPSTWVHTKDLAIVTDNQPFFSYGFTMGEVSWKK